MLNSKEYARNWYQNNKEKAKAYREKWLKKNKEKMASCRKEWRDNHPDLKKYNREYQRNRLGCIPREEWIVKSRKPFTSWRSRIKNPKKKARHFLLYAVHCGRIVKPKECEGCNKTTEKRYLHGHHTDYSKWWDVTWLCYSCHLKEHGGKFNWKT